MEDMQKEFNRIREEALAELDKVGSLNDLETFRSKYLVRKGEVSQMLRRMKNLPEGERPALGRLGNEVREKIEKAYRTKEKNFVSDTGPKGPIDVTAPGARVPEGHLHPITRMRYEVEDIFRSMGFAVIDGPDVTSDYYNFESLNIPPDHPARDMWDTIYLKGAKEAREAKEVKIKSLLRTHTSAMQVAFMEDHKPPLRVIVPGRCFRYEATDASHEHTFYQVEGFLVDEGVSIANIKAVFNELLKNIFGKKVKTRLRPSYFPFVEPGFELDIECLVCGGMGCSTCSQTGWIELIPCGLIHPKVLEYAKIDKNKYSGFAFGMGLDRLVMMRYGIEDIRWFHSGDLRFLEQF